MILLSLNGTFEYFYLVVFILEFISYRFLPSWCAGYDGPETLITTKSKTIKKHYILKIKTKDTKNVKKKKKR